MSSKLVERVMMLIWMVAALCMAVGLLAVYPAPYLVKPLFFVALPCIIVALGLAALYDYLRKKEKEKAKKGRDKDPEYHI